MSTDEDTDLVFSMISAGTYLLLFGQSIQNARHSFTNLLYINISTETFDFRGDFM